MKMKFKIDESSRLTIVDDKKEIIIDTDKADLKELVHFGIGNAFQAVDDIPFIAGHGNDAELSADAVFLDDITEGEQHLVGVGGDQGSAVLGGAFACVLVIYGYNGCGIVNDPADGRFHTKLLRLIF